MMWIGSSIQPARDAGEAAFAQEEDRTRLGLVKRIRPLRIEPDPSSGDNA